MRVEDGRYCRVLGFQAVLEIIAPIEYIPIGYIRFYQCRAMEHMRGEDGRLHRMLAHHLP